MIVKFNNTALVFAKKEAVYKDMFVGDWQSSDKISSSGTRLALKEWLQITKDVQVSATCNGETMTVLKRFANDSSTSTHTSYVSGDTKCMVILYFGDNRQIQYSDIENVELTIDGVKYSGRKLIVSKLKVFIGDWSAYQTKNINAKGRVGIDKWFDISGTLSIAGIYNNKNLGIANRYCATPDTSTHSSYQSGDNKYSCALYDGDISDFSILDISDMLISIEGVIYGVEL